MSNQRTAPKLHWWQRKEVIIVLAAISTLVLFAVLLFAIRAYHWDMTTTTTTEVTKSPQTKVTTTETGKTLLDWLQLLGVIAIPIVVGFGTAFFTRQQAKTSEANRERQHETDLQIAENQQQEELLRNYFDKISDLLLDKELSISPHIQSIVRARTLAALHILNTERKALVLRFLQDSDLLQYVKSFLYSLDLSHADLNSIGLSEANLNGTNLSKADLSRTDLSGANLSGADLSKTDLSKTYLSGSNLSGANLNEADLIGADLIGADLSGANLSGTTLWGTDLIGANLSGADLSDADLSGAYLIKAHLIKANLSDANLIRANLSEADLSRANLNFANLSQADLREANLSGADLNGATLWGASITQRLLEEAKNATPEQLTQIEPSTTPATQSRRPSALLGTASSIQLRSESTTGSHVTTQVSTFRLKQYDSSGSHTRTLFVEMRGQSIMGVISDGDKVEVFGTLENGLIRTKQVQNLTTGVTLQVK